MVRTKSTNPHPRISVDVTAASERFEGPIHAITTPDQPAEPCQTVIDSAVTPQSMPSISQSHEHIGNSEVEVNVQNVENENNENVEQGEHCERNGRSSVWNDFVKEKVKDKKGNIVIKAKCKQCNHHLSHTSGHGTSHLKRHLKYYCKRKKTGNKDVMQLLLTNSSKESGGQLKPFKFDQDVSRRSLAKFIICAELSFRAVEHPSFIEFVGSLQPLFRCVGRLTVRNDCVALYEEEKQNLHALLKSLSCRVCFTSDMWTSNQKLGYMTLTAHYIDDDFVLRKKIVSFKQVPYPHTSYAISDVIWNCILEWELEDRVLTFTLDNASTNDSVVTRLKGNYGERMLLNGSYIHIRCCAHILNILVQDGLKVMQNAIDNIRNVVRFVSATPSRMQVFNDIASQKRLPKRKGLVVDVSTRWNSTHDMLANALAYKDVLMTYVQEHGHSSLALTCDDWKKAESVCKFLKHFADATKVFSGSKYPTSNLYFKEVWNIRGLLIEEACSSDETIKNLAVEMQIKFDKYWRHCNKLLCVASMLDPRLKLGYISFSYQKEFGEEAGMQMVDEVVKFLHNLYALYENIANESAKSKNLGCETVEEGSISLASSVGNKRKHDIDYMQWWSQQQTAKRPKRNELDFYLADSSLALMSDDDFNPLAWWKNNATIYPILARMARDILAIPVSTVSSESAFSTGGRVIDPHRSRLNPDTIEALICAQDWLHQKFNIDEETLSRISTLAEELESDPVEKPVEKPMYTE